MSIYGRQVPNQMIGIISNPCEGVNEFVTPLKIGDNQLSDTIDTMPFRNSAITLYNRATLDAILSGTTGKPVESIADIDTDNYEYIYSLYYNSTSWYIQKTSLQTSTKTAIDVKSHGWPTTGQDTKFYSSCLFATQAANFVVFSCSGLAKLVY